MSYGKVTMYRSLYVAFVAQTRNVSIHSVRRSPKLGLLTVRSPQDCLLTLWLMSCDRELNLRNGSGKAPLSTKKFTKCDAFTRHMFHSFVSAHPGRQAIPCTTWYLQYPSTPEIWPRENLINCESQLVSERWWMPVWPYRLFFRARLNS
jgi:hypothetical protein